MCSTLFTIPYEWNGVPIFGFGVLLALWAVTSLVGLVRLIRQQGWSADALSFLPLALLVAAVIVLLPRVFPAGLPIRGYGVMVVLGWVAGIALAAYRAEQMRLHRELIFGLAFWLFVCGFLGARLFYVIEYWDSEFRSANWIETLTKMVKYTEGGLVVYGAFIGGSLAFAWYMRRQGLPLLAMGDIVAPSLLVGLALGRIGCLLNGCCFGGASDLPWAVTFPPSSPPYEVQLAGQIEQGELYGFSLEAEPHGADASVAGQSEPGQAPRIASVSPGSAAEQAGLTAGDTILRIGQRSVTTREEALRALVATAVFGDPLVVETASGTTHRLPAVALPARSRPVHPTQIYSAVNAALLTWLLWTIYPYRRRDGEVVAVMMTLYPISRFVLETIRIDESAVFNTGMSISQNISLVVLALAACLWLYLLSQPKRTAFSPAAA